MVSAICLRTSSLSSECSAWKMLFLKLLRVSSSSLAHRSLDRELYELSIFCSQTHTVFLVACAVEASGHAGVPARISSSVFTIADGLLLAV